MLIFFAYFIGKSECSEKSKPNFINNLRSFKGEIHDNNVEINFAHLNLWVCMSFSCVTWPGFS